MRVLVSAMWQRHCWGPKVTHFLSTLTDASIIPELIQEESPHPVTQSPNWAHILPMVDIIGRACNSSHGSPGASASDGLVTHPQSLLSMTLDYETEVLLETL